MRSRSEMGTSNEISTALAIAISSGVPVALRGRPGIGKTSIVTAVAASLGLDLEVVIGSLREPSDFNGLPVVSADGDVRLAPPAWAVRAANSPRGCVVLLDELTTASPSVQAAMLRVVREKVVGDLVLPSTVRIVAAYNDARDCGGYELEMPMRSRLVHLDVTATVDGFVDGILGDWASPLPAVRIQRDEQIERWRRLVAGFVKCRPSLLEQAPTAGSSGGYPCPRSWSMLADICSAAETMGADREIVALLAIGAVGHGPAVEFLSWADSLDLPDPVSLLTNPELVHPYLTSSRPDRTMVVVYSVLDTACALQEPTMWSNCWKVLAKVVEAGFGDLSAWAARRLLRDRPDEATVPPEFSIVQRFVGSL